MPACIPRGFWPCLVLICGCLFSAVPGWAQETAIEFPKLWLNTSPLTMEGLKGKVVVLYFYEEDCPKCKGAWPNRLQQADKYRDKPVLFVAVNSGNAPAAVAGYLKEVGVKWPAIVDLDRSYEKSLLNSEISLQNIYQCRVITPNGGVIPADPNNLTAVVDGLVGEAKWKIDPAGIAAELKPLWLSLEVGNMPEAVARFNLARKQAKKEADKSALKPLGEIILNDFNQQFTAAKEDYQAGNKWPAYKALMGLGRDFQGLDEAQAAVTMANKMKKEKEIQKELSAQKKFEEYMKQLNAPSQASNSRGLKGMEALARDFADTEAGQEAQKGLDKLKMGGM
ncbi:MAG: redoxin family protein [Pirellulales bacterium]|nr:redoxin family protein [Pirellulales bacterium]